MSVKAQLARHDGGPRGHDAHGGDIQHDLEGLAGLDGIEHDTEQPNGGGEQDSPYGTPFFDIRAVNLGRCR
ncbi:gamma-aminobutyrate permease domain protein [Mycobacterium xenopi 4042]|uniref:Gamma-aminobutyrate permease domain protein n=1 Tax=Mycobacterium xenopi 4042 TaxID=1299334 RepID=X8DLI5_MYCXE|nr:gamma-aminobutyrate permease domain protein [Mycobacterium xenopi 4042]